MWGAVSGLLWCPDPVRDPGEPMGQQRSVTTPVAIATRVTERGHFTPRHHAFLACRHHFVACRHHAAASQGAVHTDSALFLCALPPVAAVRAVSAACPPCPEPFASQARKV